MLGLRIQESCDGYMLSIKAAALAPRGLSGTGRSLPSLSEA